MAFRSIVAGFFFSAIVATLTFSFSFEFYEDLIMYGYHLIFAAVLGWLNYSSLKLASSKDKANIETKRSVLILEFMFYAAAFLEGIFILRILGIPIPNDIGFRAALVGISLLFSIGIYSITKLLILLIRYFVRIVNKLSK